MNSAGRSGFTPTYTMGGPHFLPLVPEQTVWLLEAQEGAPSCIKSEASTRHPLTDVDSTWRACSGLKNGIDARSNGSPLGKRPASLCGEGEILCER
jgi:hypothetical protein